MQSAPDELDRLMGERVRHRQEYQRILAHRDDQIDRLNHGIGPGSESWQILLDDKANARGEYEAIAGQLGRPVNRYLMSSNLFYLSAAICAAVEAPVNKFMFDIALQGSNVASFVVSFVAAAFLLLAAPLAGKLTRQVWSEYRTKFYVSNAIMAAGIMLVLFLVLSILTIARAEFSAAALTTGLDGLFSLSQKVASEGILSSVINALSDTSALVLLTFNVLGIMGAFLVGYITHDSDKHFDKAYEKHKGADRSLARRDRKFKAELDKARERARQKLDEINVRYTAANAAIVTQKTARHLTLDDDDKFALPELDRLLELVRSKLGSAADHVAAPFSGFSKTSVTLIPAREPK